MSIKIDLNTPHKATLKKMLYTIADHIELSRNETVTISLNVIFNETPPKKKDC